MASISGLLTGNPTSRSGQRATLAMCLVALLVGIVLAADPGRQGTGSPQQIDPQTSSTLTTDSEGAGGRSRRRFTVPLRV